MSTSAKADLDARLTFIKQLVESQASPSAQEWLFGKFAPGASVADRVYFMAFSAVPRFVENKPLELSEAQVLLAQEVREGFQPQHWDVVQTVRSYILLHLAASSPKDFLDKAEKLFDTADMNEQVALYATLPLYPNPEQFKARASEGIRTNMTVVFDAVALNNPYPADYMEENAWNQVFLKAAFMARPLHRIYAVEQRANEELARIVSDYAHERWAASRTVSPELWRPVGKFLKETHREDLQRLFIDENPLQKQAAALVCWESQNALAKDLLAQYPALAKEAEEGVFSWESIGKEWSSAS